MTQLKEDNYDEILSESKLEPNSTAPKSVEYLGSVFLNVVGGFFIWFHIILFIVTICSIFLFHAFTFQIYRLKLIYSLIAFIAPVVVLYGLKSCITRWLCIFTTSHQSKNTQSVSDHQSGNTPSVSDHQSENTQNVLYNNVYAFLVYLTFIFSK